jgi:hypothetical protein
VLFIAAFVKADCVVHELSSSRGWFFNSVHPDESAHVLPVEGLISTIPSSAVGFAFESPRHWYESITFVKPTVLIVVQIYPVSPSMRAKRPPSGLVESLPPPVA